MYMYMYNAFNIYIYIYTYTVNIYIYIIHTYVDSEGELGVCCSKNASLFSLGCSTATQSHGNTRIVSSPTSKQYISSCKLISPHKRNDKYSAWELHDLNFSTAILHCLSKHSTGCIFAFQGVFSSWIWLHFETYIDHCHEVIHFAHESFFCFSLDQVSSLWTSHHNMIK